MDNSNSNPQQQPYTSDSIGPAIATLQGQAQQQAEARFLLAVESANLLRVCALLADAGVCLNFGQVEALALLAHSLSDRHETRCMRRVLDHYPASDIARNTCRYWALAVCASNPDGSATRANPQPARIRNPRESATLPSFDDAVRELGDSI